MLYVQTVSIPGYMPESEPFVIETDDSLPAIPQVLEAIREEVERFADEDAMGEDAAELMAAWDDVLKEIAVDAERAASLSEAGVSYMLPGPLVIEATLRTEAELLDLGYVRGEDFGEAA